MDNKDNIKIVKRSQKLSDDELSNISGGLTFEENGVEYTAPDICPLCGKNDILTHWHGLIFAKGSTAAVGITCYRKNATKPL